MEKKETILEIIVNNEEAIKKIADLKTENDKLKAYEYSE